jgi:hypothetical protein
VAPEQVEAELFFQHPDLVAQRRLLHLQPFRCAGEVLFFGYYEEVAEVAEFHCCYLFWVWKSGCGYILHLVQVRFVCALLMPFFLRMTKPAAARQPLTFLASPRKVSSCRATPGEGLIEERTALINAR